MAAWAFDKRKKEISWNVLECLAVGMGPKSIEHNVNTNRKYGQADLGPIAQK